MATNIIIESDEICNGRESQPGTIGPPQSIITGATTSQEEAIISTETSHSSRKRERETYPSTHGQPRKSAKYFHREYSQLSLPEGLTRKQIKKPCPYPDRLPTKYPPLFPGISVSRPSMKSIKEAEQASTISPRGQGRSAWPPAFEILDHDEHLRRRFRRRFHEEMHIVEEIYFYERVIKWAKLFARKIDTAWRRHRFAVSFEEQLHDWTTDPAHGRWRRLQIHRQIKDEDIADATKDLPGGCAGPFMVLELLEEFCEIIEAMVEVGKEKGVPRPCTLDAGDVELIRQICGYYVGGSYGIDIMGGWARYYAEVGLVWDRILNCHLEENGVISLGIYSIIDGPAWETFLKKRVCDGDDTRESDLKYLRKNGWLSDCPWIKTMWQGPWWSEEAKVRELESKVRKVWRELDPDSEVEESVV